VVVAAAVPPIVIQPFEFAVKVVAATPLKVKLLMVCKVDKFSSNAAPERITVPPVIGT
jgi:hypothetical protein